MPLDDPTAGDDFEAFGGIGVLDDFEAPLSEAAKGVAELLAGITTIGEQVAQPRELGDDACEHKRRAVAILDIGGVDHRMDQIALGVGEDMALASLGLLARVIAPWPATFRGFDALTVDHPGAGRSLTANRFASNHQQVVVERLPQPVVAPRVEPAPHGRDRRETGRQHPPRQTAAHQLEDRLDNAPHRPLARATDKERSWEERLKHRPLSIGQITWQSHLASRM